MSKGIARKQRVLAALFLASMMGACTTAPPTASLAQVIEDPIYEHPQRLVQVEPGRSLNLYCSGTGTPVVVFDSGLGADVSAWGFVQPAIARHTRVCSYDRAGLGFSSPALQPGSSAAIVADLHRLLSTAQVRPPYVLVGHSYGGMNVRLFASRFPGEVLGIVLVDASHEDATDEIRKVDKRGLSAAEWRQAVVEPLLVQQRACATAARSDFKAAPEMLNKCSSTSIYRSKSLNNVRLATQRKPAFQDAVAGELQSAYTTSADELRNSNRALGDIPLVVLTRAPSAAPLSANETAESRAANYQVWVKRQEDLASLSSRGERRTIANAGHNMNLDQPGPVIDAILEVWRAVKR